MPRVRLGKTVRGLHDIEMYKSAYNEVKAGSSMRNAATKYSINHVSLSRYIKKRDTKGDEVNMGYNKILLLGQELELKDYLWECTEIFFGFSLTELRRLSFEYIKERNWSCHSSWEEKSIVGEDWFRSFLKRHPTAATISAEFRSLSYKTNCSKSVFTNLRTITGENNITKDNIYNMMDIQVFPVRKPNQDGADPGFVNAVFAANATGQVLSPYFLHHTTTGEEAQSKDSDVARSSSNRGGKNFLFDFLIHFVNELESPANNKKLLIVDDNAGHINMNALNFCREKGIVILSVPSSPKYQPLKKSVYDQMKKFLKVACASWVQKNEEFDMTVEDIPKIVTSVMPLAFTKVNLQRGFRETGIYPIGDDAVSQDSSDSSDQDSREMLTSNLHDHEKTSLNSQEEYKIDVSFIKLLQ